MANVSGGNASNRVTVSNTKAEYHSDLTKGYMEKAEMYAAECELNAARSTEQYNEITALLENLPETKAQMIEEIQNAATDKIYDIEEAVEQNKTAAITEINARVTVAENSAQLSKDWATKTSGTVDGVDYSSKYYANQAKTTAEQAITNINSTMETSLNSALSDIQTERNTAISNIESTETTAKANINTLASQKETSLNNQFNLYSNTLDDELDAFLKDNDRLYQGVDLEVKFASEIANYATVYDWLNARKNAGNFEGIHIGDYFHTSIKAGTVAGYNIAAQNFKCRIVGINTYKNCGDAVIGNMFYIHTDEVINTPILWNPTANNNGTASQVNPWLASAMYAVLNGVNNYTTSAYNSQAHGANASSGGILQLLPAALQAVMKQKRMLLDQRYSASGLLTGGTGWGWGDGGKLSLPSEIEIYGCPVRSNLCLTSGYWFPEAGLSIQFPWYANNCEHRIKKNSTGGRCLWWLSSVASYHTSVVCIVSSYGLASDYSAANASVYAPLCFCI